MTEAELKNGIERLKAISECKRLMATYTDGRNWAKLRSSSVDLPWGAYDGFRGFIRCYAVDHGYPMDDEGNPCEEEQGRDVLDEAGVLNLHCYTTPVIEVAEDGNTARGVWIARGCETYGTRTENEQDRAFCGWGWTKYAFDFIKLDGQWKIWHYRLFGLFLIRFDECWTEVRPYDGLSLMKTSEDRPPLNPPYDWSIDSLYPWNYPEPPKPYKTFADVAPGYGYLHEDGTVYEEAVHNTKTVYLTKPSKEKAI